MEIPCANCGKSVIAFEEGRTSAACECPVCRQRTTVYSVAGKQIVFSEQRLLRIFSYARSKKWVCPQHDGASVVVTGVVSQDGNPLQLTIRFLCKRSRGWRKPLAHSGSLAVNMMTLESEILGVVPRAKQ
jgi:ssDNA-binding Zn-finger/Zn-ribbon topoisomerase 1